MNKTTAFIVAILIVLAMFGEYKIMDQRIADEAKATNYYHAELMKCQESKQEVKTEVAPVAPKPIPIKNTAQVVSSPAKTTTHVCTSNRDVSCNHSTTRIN